jgi:hypothetical protein
LLPALTENGQVDLAYAIATQTTYPSWGGWIANGATTTWEQWVCDASLRSRDHAFLGTVDDWVFKYLGHPASRAGLSEDHNQALVSKKNAERFCFH